MVRTVDTLSNVHPSLQFLLALILNLVAGKAPVYFPLFSSEELARRLQEVENAAVETGESARAGPSQQAPQYPIGPRPAVRDKKVVDQIIVLKNTFLSSA